MTADIEDMRGLAEKATGFVVQVGDDFTLSAVKFAQVPDNAAFIAGAREFVPWACSELIEQEDALELQGKRIARVREENERLLKELDESALTMEALCNADVEVDRLRAENELLRALIMELDDRVCVLAGHATGMREAILDAIHPYRDIVTQEGAGQ